MVLPPIGSILLIARMNDVAAWLQSHGTTGLVLYALAFAVLAGVALLPTYASAILGGWTFGFAQGFPAALAGFLGGSLIGYAVARPLSAARVHKVLKEHPKWDAIRAALLEGSTLKKLAIVTLLRMPPNSPFAMTNLVLASVRTPVWIYTLGTLIGMAPRTGIVLYVASTLKGMAADEAAKSRPLWLIVGGIVMTIIVLGILGLVAKKALANLTRPEANPGV
jgi:uncharacterized membrane protein YdjX (TVP38/TMEM64 family)